MFIDPDLQSFQIASHRKSAQKQMNEAALDGEKTAPRKLGASK